MRAAPAEGEREKLLGELRVERARLADLFRQPPTFLAVLRGANHVFELVNDAYYQFVGNRELLGKSVFEAPGWPSAATWPFAWRATSPSRASWTWGARSR